MGDEEFLQTRRRKNRRERTIPKFTVNLSHSPGKRYAHIAPVFRNNISRSNLPGLFHDILADLAGPSIGKFLRFVSKYALCRVYTREETSEIRGISETTGVQMHILVAFNVLLDLLLGCTSGGVRVRTTHPGSTSSNMLHFRTLDWGMDRLREIVMEVNFVRSEGGPVVATSLTYFGYVGVLTGVRPGLSMSLNFRPHHDESTWRKRLSFRWHQALVLLGFRQSISSKLRQILLDTAMTEHPENLQTDRNTALLANDESADRTMKSILLKLSTSPSTAAYLIFCLPQRVYVVQKDNYSAEIRESDTFLTAYNHDDSDEARPSQLAAAAKELAANESSTGMSELVAFSLDRKKTLERMWKSSIDYCLRRSSLPNNTVSTGDVMRFLDNSEITNEETHYAVVMDPSSGTILWRRRYKSQ